MVDLQEIGGNLTNFYPFLGKRILDMGAGRGTLLDFYLPQVRSVIAVDKDEKSLQVYKEKAERMGHREKVETVVEDDVCKLKKFSVDAALFVFSFHEFDDMGGILSLTSQCTGEAVIIDHGFESEWAHYTDEEQKITRMWSFLKYWRRKWHIYEAWQVFPDYNDLKEKMRDAGETTLERIKVFEGKAPISIKMPYVLCRF